MIVLIAEIKLFIYLLNKKKGRPLWASIPTVVYCGDSVQMSLNWMYESPGEPLRWLCVCTYISCSTFLYEACGNIQHTHTYTHTVVGSMWQDARMTVTPPQWKNRLQLSALTKIHETTTKFFVLSSPADSSESVRPGMEKPQQCLAGT